MRPALPPGTVGEVRGSAPGERDADNCWSIRSSVGSLVIEHDWRNSRGTKDGVCRAPASLACACAYACVCACAIPTGTALGVIGEDGEGGIVEAREALTDPAGGTASTRSGAAECEWFRIELS